MIPLLLGGAAVAGGLWKAISGNQQKQRNKGYIHDSYVMAKQSLGVRQGQVRQSTTESLNRRGLGAGLSPLHRAIAGGAAGEHRDYTPGLTGASRMLDRARVDAYNKSQEHAVHAAPAPGSAHTLGEQLQVDNDKQFQLEQTDLEQQRAHAETENNADYWNTLVSAGLGTAQGLGGAYTVAQDQQAAKQTPQVTTPAPMASPSLYSALTGVDNPSSWFGGVVGTDPLNAFGSSWNRDKTASGDNLNNSNFHV